VANQGISMYKFLNDIFTGKNNSTFDLGRILWAMGVLVFLVLSVIDVLNGHRFDPISYGAGLGAVMALGAGALALKSKTEPGEQS
jgi:hypothetical protein